MLWFHSPLSICFPSTAEAWGLLSHSKSFGAAQIRITKVPTNRFPSKGFPGTGSQARVQEEVPKNRPPTKVLKNRFPSKVSKIGSQQDSQEQVPKGFKEQLRNRFPSKGSEEQVSKKRRPGKVPKARFPRKVRRIGKRELFPDKGFQARFPFHCGTAVPFFISFISKRPTKLNRYTSDDLCVSSHLRPSSSYYVGTKIS